MVTWLGNLCVLFGVTALTEAVFLKIWALFLHMGLAFLLVHFLPYLIISILVTFQRFPFLAQLMGSLVDVVLQFCFHVGRFSWRSQFFTPEGVFLSVSNQCPETLS